MWAKAHQKIKVLCTCLWLIWKCYVDQAGSEVTEIYLLLFLVARSKAWTTTPSWMCISVRLCVRMYCAIRSHIAQAGLKFDTYLRMTFDSWSFCLHFPKAGIILKSFHIWFICLFTYFKRLIKNKILLHCGLSEKYTTKLRNFTLIPDSKTVCL